MSFNVSLSYHVGLASTGATVVPVTGLSAPVPAGAVVGHLTVQPPGWMGTILLSGADAASHSIGNQESDGSYPIVLSAPITAKKDVVVQLTSAE